MIRFKHTQEALYVVTLVSFLSSYFKKTFESILAKVNISQVHIKIKFSNVASKLAYLKFATYSFKIYLRQN